MLGRPSLSSSLSRQAEILEVIARHGWEYARGKLAFERGVTRPSLPLPEVLRKILLELGPTFVKLGQVLSTRPDLLSPDYIAALESLQSNVPALPWSEVLPILKGELQRPIADVFAEIEETAIAAGSLGQVHRGRLLDGSRVALKVQRPGIRGVVERDLNVLRVLAEFFSNEGLGEAYDLPALFEEFRATILDELDFRREARHTEQLRQNLQTGRLWQDGQAIVPRVFGDFTRERLLVLEWIEGKKLTEIDLPAPRRGAIAALVAQLMLKQIFLDGFFHADPHPGNFLYVGDGNGSGDRIALIDCGMVARLDPRTQSILTDLLIGVVNEQPRQVAQAVKNLGFSRLPANVQTLEAAFDRLLRRYYVRPLEDISLTELLNEALRIPRDNHIQMPGTIGPFVKAIANAEGIARQLDPQFAFTTVARPVVEKAVQQQFASPNALQNAAYASAYLSRTLYQLPQRVDALLDRVEQSEGLTLRWAQQENFSGTTARSLRFVGVSLIAVGTMVSGAILLAAKSTAASDLGRGISIAWSNALLFGGAAIGLLLLLEYLLVYIAGRGKNAE